MVRIGIESFITYKMTFYFSLTSRKQHLSLVLICKTQVQYIKLQTFQSCQTVVVVRMHYDPKTFETGYETVLSTSGSA